MGDNKISEAARFTKRPVTIEAMQFDGSAKSASAICHWVNAGDDEAGHDDPTVSYITKDGEDSAHDMIVWTLEGDMRASPGDWIIKGVKGEFYPCKPEIFELTYSPHLQGETVPVDEAAILRRAAAVLDMWQGDPNLTNYMGDFRDACEILELLAAQAPQPVELSELSGNSGELPLVLAKLVSAAGLMIAEIDTCGHAVDRAYRRTLYDAWEEGKAALAATGKQQAGEVQGDVSTQVVEDVEQLSFDAREQFEAWAKAQGRYILEPAVHRTDRYYWSDTQGAWEAWQAALASRQPVGQEPVASIDPRHLFLMRGKDGTLSGNVLRFGASMQPGDTALYAAQPAQGIDLGQFREAVEAQHAALMASWCGDPETKAAADEQRDRLLALIDGRDAGTGVGS